MTIFLHRPSPQIPEPSASAARICIEAALFNIRLQREQIANKSVDLTWVFTQTLFMELNTVLWALSYPEVRKEKSRLVVEEHVRLAKDGIALASERWPGVESALGLYENLVTACLKVYNGSSEASYVIGSPSNRPVQSVRGFVTPPALSSASTVASSASSYQALSVVSNGNYEEGGQAPEWQILNPESRSEFSPTDQRQPKPYEKSELQQSGFQYAAASQGGMFDPNSVYNTLPAVLPGLQHCDPGLAEVPGTMTADTPCFMASRDEDLYLGTMGDQYSQYLHAPYIPQHRLQSLNEEQQVELMTSLEKTGLSAMNAIG